MEESNLGIRTTTFGMMNYKRFEKFSDSLKQHKKNVRKIEYPRIIHAMVDEKVEVCFFNDGRIYAQIFAGRTEYHSVENVVKGVLRILDEMSIEEKDPKRTD